MRTRRGSLLWGTTQGDAILMYKPGDVVKPITVMDQFFTGIVRDVDLKTNKVTVAWGGGPVSQHDVDEIMPMPFFDETKNGNGTKVASSRRMRADVDDLLDVPEIGEEIVESTPDSTVQTDFVEDDMEGLLNRQVGSEFYSAYLYYMVAAVFQSKGLVGFQNWMEHQGDGEIDHAMKVYKYLVDTGSTVVPPMIPGPDISSEMDVAELTRFVLDHEMGVTQDWKRIGKLAKQQDNPATCKLVQEFMDEQIEEEDAALTLHQRVQLADSGSGILLVDNDLKDRSPIAVTATNPPMSQYCGQPGTHGLETPRGGGFSIMKDLAYQLHDEANDFADVNPRLAMIRAGLKEIAWDSNTMTCAECEATQFLRRATSGDESPAQRTVEEETAKKSSDSHTATGEMGRGDIQPGGEYYSWAQAIERAAKDIQRLMRNRIRFLEVRPFDVYQGPYAQMSTGKLWSGERDGEFYYEFGMGQSNRKGVSGSVQDIVDGMRAIPGMEASDSKKEASAGSEEQMKSVEILERHGFRQVSDFTVAGEFTIVMQKRRGPSTFSGEVEEDGTVNGKSVEEFLRSAPKASTAAVDCGALNMDGLRSRRAMYWCAPDRTFRLTQQEQESGSAVCPKCKAEMQVEPFTRSEKLMICPECRFKVPTSKAVTKVEVKVPEGVSVEVTQQDGQGNDVSGQTVMAGAGRGRRAYADPAELVDLPRMSLGQVAMLVYKDWKNVNYAAKPYLEAMATLHNVSDMYGQDSGTSIVAYFLSNATSWRGEVAKAVKKELQRRIRR